jgi:hypothetical protein
MIGFEVLVVDNDAEWASSVERRLSRQFGSLLKIRKAHTLSDAGTLIRRMAGALDGAILDFHFSAEVAVDESLCGLMRKYAGTVPVFHYTAYAADHRILEHMQKHHSGDAFHVISKFPTSPEPNLDDVVASALFGEAVSDWLTTLLGPRKSPFLPRPATLGPVSQQDVFLPGLQFTALAEKGWRALGTALRERISQTLHVVVSGSSTKIHLTDAGKIRADMPHRRSAFRFELCYELIGTDYAIPHELLSIYEGALKDISIQRRPPSLVGLVRIPALLLHVGATFPNHDQSFTDLGEDGLPYIALPVWGKEQFGSSHHHDAIKYAYREGSRALSMTHFRDERPPPAWWWWIEAVARRDWMSAARFVPAHEESPEPIPFLSQDANRPIDAPASIQEAALFVEFLRLWNLADHPNLMDEVLAFAPMTADAWKAVEAGLFENFQEGVSFVGDFARHAYFVQDPQSVLFTRGQDLGRVPGALINLSALAPGQEKKFVLDHLSRLYLQITATAPEGLLEVEVNSDDPAAARYLNVEICPQTAKNGWSAVYQFVTVDEIDQPGSTTWTREALALEGPVEQNEWILIVSNCGLGEKADHIEFWVRAKLAEDTALTCAQSLGSG